MKISLDWLSEHIDVGNISVDELSDLLTFAGVEVEEIESPRIHEKIVVAEVVEKAPHPDADKLTVCKVEHGGQVSQIVCGATNFQVGSKVPLALPGAVLPDGMKIKKGKLRGVASEGMMCSAKELAVSADASGLLLLDEAATTGEALRTILSPDTQLTIEVTPNRPDWLSHLGLAREVAAVTSRPLKGAATIAATEATRPATDQEIHLDPNSACPFYSARIIRGVHVKQSPLWLRARLEAVGLRPINNIVDITNFVLMDMGQPLHAFDLAKLSGGIQVRPATEGEQVVALDGETYELSSSDTVIADAEKALAIAGVMGGESSGVVESTTDILLESAYFDPPAVRRSSHRLSLSSDSSYRFERGVDPKQVLGASEQATKLILELAGGTAEDAIQVAGTAPELVNEVSLDHDHCRSLLGVDVDDDTIESLLTKLGLVSATRGGGKSTWKIPSYRLDLQREVDLIEEVARLHGLDKVPANNVALTALPRHEDHIYDISMDLKKRLVTLGFCETPTLSMVSEGQIDGSVTGANRQPVPIKNPLGSDYKMMRTSLLSGLAVNELASGLLNVARRNANLGAASVRVFELGTVYTTEGEEPVLSLLVAGDANDVSWMTPRPKPLSIHDMRGLIQALLPQIPLRLDVVESEQLPLCADLLVRISGNETRMGQFGQCPPSLAREIGYGAVSVAELRVSVLQKMLGQAARYEAISPYPAITRDVAMELAQDVANQRVSDFFRGYKEDLIESYSLFDLFSDPTGEKLDASKKSLAYTITYRAKNKTLESKVVDKAHAKLLKALQTQLGVTIR